MHVRVCSDCGEEFRPEIARCSDCGGALVDRHEGEDGAGRAAGDRRPAEAELADAHPVARAMDVRDLVPLADGLAAASIACRIIQRPPLGENRAGGYDLTVKDGERLKATAVLELVPGFENARLEAPLAPEGGAAMTLCPACGTEVPEGVAECLECGLILGAEPGD